MLISSNRPAGDDDAGAIVYSPLKSDRTNRQTVVESRHSTAAAEADSGRLSSVEEDIGGASVPAFAASGDCERNAYEAIDSRKSCENHPRLLSPIIEDHDRSSTVAAEPTMVNPSLSSGGADDASFGHRSFIAPTCSIGLIEEAMNSDARPTCPKASVERSSTVTVNTPTIQKSDEDDNSMNSSAACDVSASACILKSNEQVVPNNSPKVPQNTSANAITPNTNRLTPDQLPLIELTQDDIDRIVDQIEGGVTNIQDIYALSPFQDSIISQRFTTVKSNPHFDATLMSFDNRDILDRYLKAFQKVVDRHDITRTAFIWEHLSTPAQVVLRQVPLSITELTLNLADGPISEQLKTIFGPLKYRIDLTQAPLIRFIIAQDGDGRWITIQLMHRLINDQYSLTQMQLEIQAFLEDRGNRLLPPKPFRDFIAKSRSGPSLEDHEKYFTKILGKIETPAPLYGLSNIHSNDANISESTLVLPQELSDRLRDHAKRMGASLAEMCHLTWALVIARTNGQERVVIGATNFGGLAYRSTARVMGPSTNTLPLHVDLGNTSVEGSVQQIHADMEGLLNHEHATLALAQRCSSVPAGTPLFNSVLDYRQTLVPPSEATNISGIQQLDTLRSIGYPLVMNVEDRDDEIILTVQTMRQFEPSRICGYMQQGLHSLANALERTPDMPIRDLEILPAEEREMLIRLWNSNEPICPDHQCIHNLFEDQVKQSPDSIAIVYQD
ncbi:hypothetical protein BGX26_003599, partial [Mortierella sp. AD094]